MSSAVISRRKPDRHDVARPNLDAAFLGERDSSCTNGELGLDEQATEMTRK
jgi:hypothetical protein